MHSDLPSINVNSDVYNYDYFLQDNVCRFCWNKRASTPIFEAPESGSNYLLNIITDCLTINLTLLPKPNKACDDCCSQIYKFHRFREFCLETNRRLHDIFIECRGTHPVKSEKESSDFEFLDCAKDSDSEVEIKKKAKVKWKYKPKRTPTYCNICRIDCENADNLKVHNSKFHGIEIDGVFKCFGCEKRFKNRKTRLGHENNFCKNLKNGYKCAVCDSYLPRRGMYEAHMRDHRKNISVQLPEDIFKCKDCDKLFKSKDLLKNHTIEHKRDLKSYVCESCGRAFTRKDYLHKHKLTHTGEKHHVCSHCGFRTTQRSSLTVHIRKHTGERPFKCSMCPQRCISSSNLSAHQQRHLGLKLHECKICNKKFGYKISLKEHMSTHAPAQTHSCAHCSAAYSRLRALKRHIAAKHNDIGGVISN